MKTSRRYALIQNFTESPIVLDLEYDLAEELRAKLRNGAMEKTTLSRYDARLGAPRSKSREDRKKAILDGIICHDCHHAARMHPATGYRTVSDEERPVCIECYMHDGFEHEDRYIELPVCENSVLDVILEHMLGEKREPYYVEFLRFGQPVYATGNGLHSTPTPLFDAIEAQVVADWARRHAHAEGVQIFHAPSLAATGGTN